MCSETQSLAISKHENYQLLPNASPVINLHVTKKCIAGNTAIESDDSLKNSKDDLGENLPNTQERCYAEMQSALKSDKRTCIVTTDELLSSKILPYRYAI